MVRKNKPTIWVSVDSSFNLPPDTFEVSNYGECKNIKTSRTKNVKPNKDKYIIWQYYTVDGKHINLRAHIVIAVSFKLPKLDGQTTVDHIDRDPSNNCLENLRWASPKEQNKNRTPQTNYLRGQIEQYELNGTYIKTWNSNKEASETLKISKARISDVCSGRAQSAGGFTWKYAETEDLPDETWEEFQRYFVSSHGRIKSPKEIIMKLQIYGAYNRIKINQKKYSVSNLVCILFHGEKPSDNHTVDHIDGNTLNNHKDNLRWATKIEQATNRKNVEKINQICPTTNKVLGTFNSASEAARELGIVNNVLLVCKGMRKTCGGFIFKFAE